MSVKLSFLSNISHLLFSKENFSIFTMFFRVFVWEIKTCAVSDCIIFPLQRKFSKIREMIKRTTFTTFLKKRSVLCLFFIHQIDLNGCRGEFTFFHFSEVSSNLLKEFLKWKRQGKLCQIFCFYLKNIFRYTFLIEIWNKKLNRMNLHKIFKKWNVFVFKVVKCIVIKS